jgi:hypothetical protein
MKLPTEARVSILTTLDEGSPLIAIQIQIPGNNPTYQVLPVRGTDSLAPVCEGIYKALNILEIFRSVTTLHICVVEGTLRREFEEQFDKNHLVQRIKEIAETHKGVELKLDTWESIGEEFGLIKRLLQRVLKDYLGKC